jgi:putative aldouronate transport system permease protein
VIDLEAIGAIRKAKNREFSHPLVYVLRVMTLLSAAAMFISGINPVRVGVTIDKNASLFTCATSYDSAIGSGFARALQPKNGWIQQDILNLVYIAALVMFVAIVAIVAGGALSLGFNRMKKMGAIISCGASVVGLVGVLLSYFAYNQFVENSRLQIEDGLKGRQADIIAANWPMGIWVFLAIFLVVGLTAAAYVCFGPKLSDHDMFGMHPKFRLFLMMMPFILLVALFSYLPLSGWAYSFFNYKAGSDLLNTEFVGFKWFTFLFENPAQRNAIVRVLGNTMVMSGIGIATSWLPMAFAIFLAEMSRGAPRRVVQTITTIPNFISWVLVYAVAFTLFSTEGFVNSFLENFGVESTTNYLMSSDGIWLKMWLWGTWKGLGWSAIVYIAAISGIDQQLYEAATIDGAGRFRKMWHITVPGLIPTFSVLLLLSIANILTNGMDQYLVFSNAANKQTIEVLDLYVYNIGLGASATSDSIPIATAVSMFKSIISVTLLFTANRISKFIRGESIV